jgi:N-acetylglucosaminyldiphosphoundecaprenol N-acetyl-beta-D-mannosaminyltransferase
MRVDATTHQDAVDLVFDWVHERDGRYVCVACVNNVMAAREDPDLLRVINEADLVTPDGMPLVWALRQLGVEDATRVRGIDLTINLLEEAARSGVPVGFYGSSPEVLRDVQAEALRRWPALRITYAVSPPFRELTELEQAKVVRDIRASGARVLFVGLGCPKQEAWMGAHHAALGCVLVGVGAAFDFLAGHKRQAPAVMQRLGLEWLFRLLSEPRRLWKRYLRQNPKFLALWTVELLTNRRRSVQAWRSGGDD